MRSLWLFLILAASGSSYAQRLTAVGFGGTGSESNGGTVIDPSGNIWITGTTSSFDLPVVLPWQSANRGTRIVVSTDSGATWKPVPNMVLDSGSINPSVLALDSADPLTLYTAAYAAVYRSTDGGRSAGLVSLPLPTSASIGALLADPTNPKILYAGVIAGPGIWKSIDGGISWIAASVGLPNSTYVSSITIDPRNPRSLWIWTGYGGYVSRDGAATWTTAPAPFAGGSVSGSGVGFYIDSAGIIYAPAIDGGRVTYQRSRDGGSTWTTLKLPFSSLQLTLDPVRSGSLYAASTPIGGPYVPYFFRSRDFGDTWEQFVFPSGNLARITVDPSNSDILLAGALRSTDGGKTWTRTGASRNLFTVFSPAQKGLVYAIDTPSLDAFLVKYAPDGRTVLRATYFGGMGDDAGSAAAVDPAGNIWIAGMTRSADLPVTANAVQSTLADDQDLYLARFDSNGTLTYCTYLGGNNVESVTGLATDSSGSVWITGTSFSTDFPTTDGTKPSTSAPGSIFATRLDPAAGKITFSSFIGGSDREVSGGIAVDASDNVVLTGSTYSSDFPITGPSFAPGEPSSQGPRAYVIKLNPGGKRILAITFGGIVPAKLLDQSYNYSQAGVAVALDRDANIYITGYTSMTDFPTSAGAYQTKSTGGCSTPASSLPTGLIGSIIRYAEDDVFLVKLSPDGKSMLYSTLLGATCYERPTSLTVDANGAVTVAGWTNSTDFPNITPLEGPPGALVYKAFLATFNPDASQLTFSSYLSAGGNALVVGGPNGTVRLSGASSNALLYTVDVNSPPPPVHLADIRNGFSFVGGPIASREILVLTVPDLPADIQGDVGLAGGAAIGANLAGVEVLFDGQPGLVMSAGAGRVFAIAPLDLTLASMVSVKVRVKGLESNEFVVAVAESAPGTLSLDGTGTGQANARNADGSLNGPDHRAAPGSKLTLFFTGGARGASTVETSLGRATVNSLGGFVPGILSATVTLPDALPQPSGTYISIGGNQPLRIYIQ